MKDRLIRAGDKVRQSEEGGVYQLEHLGANSRVARDELSQAADGRIVFAQFLDHFDAERRHTGQKLNLGDDLLELFGAKQILQSKGSSDGVAEDFRFQRFGKVLM